MSLTMQLDQSQKAFCEAINSNIRLLAPAGCGKTLSLLHRCLYLSSQGLKRFLIVTFTVAARQEVVARINEDSQFKDIRDNIDVATLNAWGNRRLKIKNRSYKIIASRRDRDLAFKHNLRPVWLRHERVKEAAERLKSKAPRAIMETIDMLKTLGFDHIRHTNLEEFAAHLTTLEEQGLGEIFQEKVVDVLGTLKILETKLSRGSEEHLKQSSKDIYRSFFKFWRDAVRQLGDSAIFTLGKLWITRPIHATMAL